MKAKEYGRLRGLKNSFWSTKCNFSGLVFVLLSNSISWKLFQLFLVFVLVVCQLRRKTYSGMRGAVLFKTTQHLMVTKKFCRWILSYNSNSWWESFSEGWPSGHTLIAVGMAITIHSSIKSKFWRYANVIYPILIGLSVSTAFHWMSDVITGAILGIIVGSYFSKFAPKSQTKIWINLF